jgi:hypothetical protein
VTADRDDPSCSQRGMHNINDEIVFANHDGHIFHDSRGFEAGAEDELKIVQEFVRRKSQERRLQDRLHAVWYVLLPLGISSRRFTRVYLSGTASRWTMIDQS